MINKENNFISAVLYVHNDEQIIGSFLERLNSLFSENFKRYELICVDDCSSDGSAKTIKSAAANTGESAVVLISMGFYQGVESAMSAGVDFASGDFVFEFDNITSDYDMSLVMDVYNRCISGFDIVGASSKARGRKTSRLFYSLFNKNSRAQYKIQSESFRILSRRAINRINQMSITIPYRKAVYANCGLKYDRIIYQPLPDSAAVRPAQSSYRQGLAFDSFIIFTNIAYKLSLLLTIAMLCTTLFFGVYTIVVYIAGNPVAGWTTMMILLSVGFFGMFGIFSIVLKYLSIIVNLIFKKTKYITGNIEKL